MNKNIAFVLLLLFYFSTVFIKLIISPSIYTPTILGDEAIYLWIAEAPFQNQITIGNNYPPLYPYLLSFFVTEQPQITYLCSKAFNIFISSLIIFPVFYLSNLFLNNKKSLIISFCSMIIPISFTYSFLVMSENLFFPLFLTSVYLIFKAEKENKWYFYSTAGVFMTLTTLTRIIGLVLISSYILHIYLYKFSNPNPTKDILSRWKIPVLTFALTISPFVLYNGISSGFNEHGLVGYSFSSPLGWSGFTLTTFLKVFVSHFDYLILGTGIILGLFSIVSLFYVIKNSDKSLFGNFTVFTWICVFTTILVCSIFLIGEYRTISRYVAFLIPLLFITGFKSLYRWNTKIRKTFLVIMCGILPLIFLIIKTTGNETEILKGYGHIYIFLILLGIFGAITFFPKINNIKKKRILKILTIFSVVSILIYSINIDLSERTIASKQTYLNEVIGWEVQHHNDKIIFDINDRVKFRNYYWKLQFWTVEDVCLGSIEDANKFFVSSEKLPHYVTAQQFVNVSGEENIMYLYEFS